MHDIKSIRDNPQAFDAGLKRRGLAPLSAGLLAIDEKRRAAILASEQAQARRNAASTARHEVATGHGIHPDWRKYRRITRHCSCRSGNPGKYMRFQHTCNQQHELDHEHILLCNFLLDQC